MEIYVLFTLLTVFAQFITIRLVTGDEWFPKMPATRAAFSQGAIAFLLAIFVGTVLSSGLWLLVFIIPGVFVGIEAALPGAGEPSEAGLRRGGLWSLLIALTPFLYLIIRMIGQVRARRAREAWQESTKGPTL